MPKTRSLLTYFTGQNRPLKKVDTNRHFQGTRTSQLMGCLLVMMLMLTTVQLCIIT